MAREFSGDPATQAQPVPTVSVAVDQLQNTLQADQAKARFKGELLGIFISPTEADWPAAVRRDRSCELPVSKRTSPLDFARPFDLPTKWTPRDPESPLPLTFACGAAVTTLSYEYVSAGGGPPASLGIVRTVDHALGVDVAADRVTTMQIGGRAAIVVRPASPDGIGLTSEVIFPEPFGFTDIYAFSISEQELLAIATSVSAAD
jgi:hypothetical protein